jgi:hypothetical protein
VRRGRNRGSPRTPAARGSRETLNERSLACGGGAGG